jgi:hypothetical protein
MTAFDLDRFRKVVGLLASDHDGERAAAALKATAMLRAAGRSWADIGVGTTTDAHAAMMVQFYANALELERSHTTHMAEEITRLKREVARLKGMWPKVPA